ncbi:MAG: beta-1,6-N-acetylglucosaminyltransferase, partial [Candidatus Binatia bacterium]
ELDKDGEAIYIRAEYIAGLPPRLKKHFRRRSRWFCFEFRDRFVRTPIPLPRPRTFSIDWKGVFWCILTREFCQWIVSDDFVKKCSRYLRHTKIPDELIMPTLVMNSPFRDSMAFDDKREVIWTGKPHPKTLTMDDHDRLLASNAFFARKFDENVDRDILFALADRIGAEPAS